MIGEGGIGPVRPGNGVADAAGPVQPDRLEQASRDFEAILIQEMLKAMRETVPEGGLLDAGRSEEMFSAMLDDQVARSAASRSEGSLAAALYRQLRGGGPS